MSMFQQIGTDLQIIVIQIMNNYESSECDNCKLRWRCPNDDVEVWYCPYFQPEDQSNMLLY